MKRSRIRALSLSPMNFGEGDNTEQEKGVVWHCLSGSVDQSQDFKKNNSNFKQGKNLA